MATVQLSTNCKQWMKGFATDVTATSTLPAPQVADPIALDGCVNVQDMNLIKVAFYGSITGNGDADGAAMDDMELYGWSPLVQGSTTLWIPTFIGRFDVVLGGAVGVAGQTVINTQYFADSITLEDGDESCRVISGIADRIASVTVDLEGAKRFQVVAMGDPTANNKADNQNYLYSVL